MLLSDLLLPLFRPPLLNPKHDPADQTSQANGENE
jgi:hypothetical protein